MITSFKNVEMRESGVIYNSTLEKIKLLYSQNPAMAGELAIAAIELTLTGEMSSDDVMIQIMLKELETIGKKNRDKYDKKMATQKQKRMEENKLEEIAELHLRGLTQAKIGQQLGLSQQNVSYRLQMIRNDYPELLKVDFTNDTKNTKNTTNDNVNDNDNDNDNVNDKIESCSGEHHSTGESGALGAPSSEKFVF